MDFPYYSATTFESIASLPISVWENEHNNEKIILFARPSAEFSFDEYKYNRKLSKKADVIQILERLNLLEIKVYCTKKLTSDNIEMLKIELYNNLELEI